MSRFLTKILNEPPGTKTQRVDAEQTNKVDAHIQEQKTPTNQESERPQLKVTDAPKENADAKTPTQIPLVDTKPPAKKRSGRQNKKYVDAHKKDRHRADLVRQHFRITPALDEQIRLFRAKKNLDLQEFYQLAAAHFLSHVDAHTDKDVDTMASLDDRDMMIMYKTTPSIINLYLEYNPENKWKVADDQEAHRYNSIDIRLIEIAIIRTQFNANFKKINSFKYYVTEIEENLAVPLGEETIEVMLKRGRERWQQARPQ